MRVKSRERPTSLPSINFCLTPVYLFLLSRRGNASKPVATKYNFADLYGGLSWKEDAVATQRSIRDELN